MEIQMGWGETLGDWTPQQGHQPSPFTAVPAGYWAHSAADTPVCFTEAMSMLHGRQVRMTFIAPITLLEMMDANVWTLNNQRQYSDPEGGRSVSADGINKL